MAFAEEDEIDDELVDVEGEEQAVVGDEATDGEGDEDLSESTTSPYANTYLLFTKPLFSPGNQLDLPGGVPVEFLIGFQNKAEELDFVVETVEASFRYPMDFNYFIQNFSAIAYNREVKPGHEATVSYSFLPADAFAGRPFGLNILLSYRDSNGAQFSESVFNETISITEVDEGLDGETFFLYLFLVGILILVAVVGHQFMSGGAGKRKRGTTQRKVVEVGTSNNVIDYDWLPEDIKKSLRKSIPVFNSGFVIQVQCPRVIRV